MGLIKQNREFEIDLLKVNYEIIPFREDSPEDFKFVVQDNYEIKDFNEDIVGITLTRKVYYKPEMFFNILVKLRVFYKIDKEEKKELNKFNLKKELEGNKKTLLSPLVNKASLLIANITNADDNLSVITPPFLQK
ncbi:MAG: hypothetical protein K9K32_05250 [Halanaerobiales bacterium]|nr:hypothetical protein [Halanaerobiales bacterium]